MKPLRLCANGHLAPPQPPSNVLCTACFARLDAKMRALVGAETAELDAMREMGDNRAPEDVP